MNIEQLTIESGRFAVEYRLRERERFLRTLIGNLPGVVYRCRTDERFTSEFISDGCLELTGYTADELTRVRAATWDEIIYAQDRERVRAEIKRSMDGNTALTASPLQIAYRIVHRDGSVRHVRDRFRFINDSDGKIVALEGFIADITGREIANERVRESEARYRLLAENMCDLVCLHEPDGRYVYVSPSSVALLGYTPDELVGTSPYDYIHEEEIPCVRDDTHERLLRGENDLTVSYRMRQKSGEYVWLESMAQIVADKNGKPSQLLTVSRDVTKRKIAEDERRAAQEEIAQLFMSEQTAHTEAKAARLEAEHANRAKDEFLQLISHEFRTPLTTIKMLARVMQKGGESPEERHEYLETIAAECDRQIDMILNLLDVARIDEGSMDLRLERVDVNRLLRSCDKIERHAANAREQKFDVEYDATLPPARGDEKAIRRALCSIIENAIKYTAVGGAIAISAKYVYRTATISNSAETSIGTGTTATAFAPETIAENDSFGEIAISIADTGRGIHTEDIPHLFQKFYRGTKPVPHDHTTDGTPDDAMGRAETPGVGLGLYLAKRLIKELGGRIEVESEVGRGSCFTVYLAVWNDATDKIDAIDEYGFDEGAAR
ncbi:MAG: PAS domain-containing sensor histidine kinase [Acidobacteriota bacterium]|nr:PAS domain-containing sensor histidine kinase [Acidobacteriota bacterium]